MNGSGRRLRPGDRRSSDRHRRSNTHATDRSPGSCDALKNRGPAQLHRRYVGRFYTQCFPREGSGRQTHSPDLPTVIPALCGTATRPYRRVELHLAVNDKGPGHARRSRSPSDAPKTFMRPHRHASYRRERQHRHPRFQPRKRRQRRATTPSRYWPSSSAVGCSTNPQSANTTGRVPPSSSIRKQLDTASNILRTANDLKRGANDIRRRMRGATHRAVGIAQAHHHRGITQRRRYHASANSRLNSLVLSQV